MKLMIFIGLVIVLLGILIFVGEHYAENAQEESLEISQDWTSKPSIGGIFIIFGIAILSISILFNGR